jgi:hypothetical protein
MIEIPANVTGVQDLFADLIGGTSTGASPVLPVKADQNVAQEIVVQ